MPPDSCSERLEALLTRIADDRSQGPEIYTRLYADSAREGARSADRRAVSGKRIGALDGTIVSLKASIDVAGFVTTAGSPQLASRPPASSDAELVARLRDAGAVIVGTVQMTELAFSGLGLNPHERLLRNPRDLSRITGGSSSGSAASVAANLADISIGGDTGGSIRIPAALCGLTGFKPTHGRVPSQGVFPLSTTLDCNGPLAKTVQECADAFAELCGIPINPLMHTSFDQRITPVSGFPCRELDRHVAKAFDRAISTLSRQGFIRNEVDLDSIFLALSEMDRIGVFTVSELLATLADENVTSLANLDAMVHRRLQAFEHMSAVDYVRICRRRTELVRDMDTRLRRGEILAMPTVPCVAPRIDEVGTVESQLAAAARLVQNTRLANLLDLPAITLPLPTDDSPSGLMLMTRRGNDLSLLAAAKAVEAALGCTGQGVS